MKNTKQFLIPHQVFGEMDWVHLIHFITTKWADAQIKFNSSSTELVVSFEGFDADLASGWFENYLNMNEIYYIEMVAND